MATMSWIIEREIEVVAACDLLARIAQAADHEVSQGPSPGTPEDRVRVDCWCGLRNKVRALRSRGEEADAAIDRLRNHMWKGWRERAEG